MDELKKRVVVEKNNGSTEDFDGEKLKGSLLRSGASIVLANEIIDEVIRLIPERTTTTEIYKAAFDVLHSKETPTAMKYSLRRSIFSLGPTGFPFEKFLEKVFRKRGYETETQVMYPGKCVEHEIDVLASDKNGDFIMVEAKFHNAPEIKTDTKVVLYVKARFEDIMNTEYFFAGKKRKINRAIVATNTKFTDNAIKYANCAGLDLIGWDYPYKGNLYELIEDGFTYPITIIQSLSNSQKNDLIESGILTCDQILDDKNNIKLDKDTLEKVITEVEMIKNN